MEQNRKGKYDLLCTNLAAGVYHLLFTIEVEEWSIEDTITLITYLASFENFKSLRGLSLDNMMYIYVHDICIDDIIYSDTIRSTKMNFELQQIFYDEFHSFLSFPLLYWTKIYFESHLFSLMLCEKKPDIEGNRKLNHGSFWHSVEEKKTQPDNIIKIQ